MSDAIVKKGEVVAITYTITDTEGKVLEQNDVPVEYLHDTDVRMFPKIMANLDGRRVEDVVDVYFDADENAFGEHNPELTYTDEVENIPPEHRAQLGRIGAEVMFQNDAGDTITMRVVRIEDGKIYLDGNNHLIGRDVVFHVKVVNIRPATEAELAANQAQSGAALH
ncbi:MAG TPA: peptidylprolyl isomerase [Gammaproteobacteria bacterium]|nr:peptidylprolyl isomerase [Gammaproteobacteria bacterium]